MQDSQRTLRFIEAFVRLYGRAPKREDAKGDFKQVAKDMQSSVGAARYYLRLAAEPRKQIDGKIESQMPYLHIPQDCGLHGLRTHGVQSVGGRT